MPRGATQLTDESNTELSLSARLATIDWAAAGIALDEMGHAHLPGLLLPSECAEVASWYGDDRKYRSTVVMSRHGFGQGEYRYFAYPLPRLVGTLRRQAYPHLATIANRWAGLLGEASRYPGTLDQFTAECHASGQSRPTPLILRYEAGGHNRLHQDLYGDIALPLQLAILLSEPGRDFIGGEFILAEQRPRMQSRAEVVPLGQGDAVVFAVNERPVKGTRGYYRARMRHGVSTIRSGNRTTLGIIFHDAR